MTKIRAVLFDLDGTLLDTASDLLTALNRLREEHHLPAISLATMKTIANLGSKAFIKLGFNVDADKNIDDFQQLRQRFISFYDQHLTDSTQFFPQVDEVLTYLDKSNIPWGIVTNKLTRHTMQLLKALQFEHRPACVICGDTLTTYKPDPAPILHACQLLNELPNACLYVGYALTDVTASKAAGTQSLVAMYGYINHEEEDPHTWGADGYIKEPADIIHWLKKYPLNK